jgi:hypothetical protein
MGDAERFKAEIRQWSNPGAAPERRYLVLVGDLPGPIGPPMGLWRAQVFFLGDLIEDDFSDLDVAKRWAEATMSGRDPSLTLQWRGAGNAHEAGSSPTAYARIFRRA